MLSREPVGRNNAALRSSDLSNQKYASSFSCCLAAEWEHCRASLSTWTEPIPVRVSWSDILLGVEMNLCALTMRTHVNVKDDRPFSGPIRTYVAPFKGLKGQRNTASVTYRSNFLQDDLDDPELAFDNNNSCRSERIIPHPDILGSSSVKTLYC